MVTASKVALYAAPVFLFDIRTAFHPSVCYFQKHVTKIIHLSEERSTTKPAVQKKCEAEGKVYKEIELYLQYSPT